MQFGLVVLNGVHKGRHIPLTTSPFLIGRGQQCHLRPVREDVGREHCAIERRGDALYLRDCGSTNGTILNARAVVQGEVQVGDGDVFDIGPLRFRFEVHGAPAPIVVSASESDSCFDVNDIFTGEPGEQEPKPDSTVQISSPMLPAGKHAKPLTDECEKMY